MSEQKNPEILDNNGEIKKSKGDFFLKIISVLTAVLIWFWVVGFESQVTQRRFTNIPVRFENLNEMRDNYNYSIIVEKDLYIDVTLEGRSAQLNRIRNSDIEAFINLSTVTKPGEQPLDIEIKAMDNVHVVNQSQSSTLLYIDVENSRTIPVDARIIQMEGRDPNVEIGELRLSTNSVTVYGPDGVLQTLSHAQVNLSLPFVERPVTVIEQFILINNDGEEVRNQFISTRGVTSVEVTVPVTMTKEIPLAVNLRYGYYTDKNSDINIVPDKITISGSPDFINNISEYNIGTIDEKRYDSDTTLTMPIAFPDGIASDTHAADVEIKLINIESKIINVSTRQNSNFNIIPPPNFEYSIREDRIQVKVLGDPETLSRINSSRISVTADMSALTERSPHLVPLVIEIISNNADNPAFCVGEYLINVEIY